MIGVLLWMVSAFGGQWPTPRAGGRYLQFKTSLIYNIEDAVMKRLLAGATLVALAVSAMNSQPVQAAVAIGDTLTFTGGDLGGPGGRFHVVDNTSGDHFDTFCVELFEHLAYGGTYVVDGLSTQTISSG